MTMLLNALLAALLAALLSVGPCAVAAMPDRLIVPGADSCAIAAGDALPFDVIDADGDGSITPDELAEWFVSDDPSVSAFDVFDTDMDGTVTPDEFTHLCIMVDDAIDA